MPILLRKLTTRSLLLLATMALVSGCAVTQTAVKPPGTPAILQTASKQDLIALYNRQAEAVKSLNASVTMTLTAGSAYTGVIKQYHEVSGFIVAEKPSMIRVIGQAPLVGTNIFDMESDGKTFNIYIPSQNKFLTGSSTLERKSSNAIENLRPQHLTTAIFWDAIAPQEAVLFEEASENPPVGMLPSPPQVGNSRGTARGTAQGTSQAISQYYVLTIARLVGAYGAGGSGSASSGDWEIARKVWFERVHMSVARVQTYDPGGQISSDVQYSGWDMFGAEKYPRQIDMTRPQNDYELQIGIVKLTLNEPNPADRFVLQQPAGSTLVRVGEEAPGKKP